MFRHLILISVLSVAVVLANNFNHEQQHQPYPHEFNVNSTKPEVDNHGRFAPSHNRGPQPQWHRRVRHGADVFHRMRQERPQRVEEPVDARQRQHEAQQAHEHGKVQPEMVKEEIATEKPVISEPKINEPALPVKPEEPQKVDQPKAEADDMPAVPAEVKPSKLELDEQSINRTPLKKDEASNDFHAKPWHGLFKRPFGLPYPHPPRFAGFRGHHFTERLHEQPLMPHAQDSLVHFTAGATSPDHATNGNEIRIDTQRNDDHSISLRVHHFNRGHFWDRMPDQRRPFSPDETRDKTLRGVNRPSDILIRNTFQENPKAWIDLRISIDENGVLNVEAGPQGVQNLQNSTRAGRAEDHLPETHPQIPVPVKQEPQTTSLEDHWLQHRPIQHTSNVWEHQQLLRPVTNQFQHGHVVNDKRVPFWFSQHHNAHERFHQPEPKAALFVAGDSKTTSTEGKKSQEMIFGPSHPPHIPAPVMQSKPEENKQKPEQNTSQKSQESNTISKLDQKVQNEPAAMPTKEEQINAASLLIAQPEPSAVEDVGPMNSFDLGPTPKIVPIDQDFAAEDEEVKIEPVISIDDSMNSGCPTLSCSKQCPGDLSKLDLNSGCPTCDCCPDVVCRTACPNGYESDQYGCPICRCIN